MKKLPLLLTILLPVLPAFGQSKVQSIIAQGYTNNLPRTASIMIGSNEAFRVLSIIGSPGGRNFGIPTIEKNGIVFPDAYDVTVAGPAVVSITFSPMTGYHETDSAMLTLERWRVRQAVPLR